MLLGSYFQAQKETVPRENQINPVVFSCLLCVHFLVLRGKIFY